MKTGKARLVPCQGAPLAEPGKTHVTDGELTTANTRLALPFLLSCSFSMNRSGGGSHRTLNSLTFSGALWHHRDRTQKGPFQAGESLLHALFRPLLLVLRQQEPKLFESQSLLRLSLNVFERH